ncbi:MAG TPA: transposase, partial [Anaerolineae bacterium]
MDEDSTEREAVPALLAALFELVAAHRPAFRQERPYRRAVALVLGELFAFARHTVTQSLLALGLSEADWTGWYRLFSRRRFDETKLAQLLLGQTLRHSPSEGPYVTGIDTTQIPRTSYRMPGSSWLRAPRTPVFMKGIHRAQRFLHGAWLPPIEEGYSRAIPLRFLPAFPLKARPAEGRPCKEWEAGLAFIHWVRQELDAAGRAAQQLLVLADGAYDTLGLWLGLPANTVLVVRTAKNRRLRALPAPYSGRGRRRKYG